MFSKKTNNTSFHYEQTYNFKTLLINLSVKNASSNFIQLQRDKLLKKSNKYCKYKCHIQLFALNHFFVEMIK